MLAAFPPIGIGLLMLVALAPWIASLRHADGRAGWRSGYLLGVLYGAGQLFWMFQFVERWTGNSLLAAIPYLAATLLFAIYFGLVGIGVARAWAWNRPWLIPLIWAGVEVFRSFVPVLAFPWGILAAPLAPVTPLIQGAWFGTVYFVSAFLVAFSTALAVWLSDGDRKEAKPLWLGVAGYLLLASIRFAMPESGERRVVALIQPGVDMAFGDPASEPFRLRQALIPLISQAEGYGASVIVMPEGVVNATGAGEPDIPFPPPATPVLVGGQRGSDPRFQSAFMLRDGGIEPFDKTRLVIFGEFVPFRQFLPKSFRLPSGDLQPGRNGVHPLNQGEYRVGPLLCFEGLFADLSYRQALHQPDFLAILSIDDWYMGTNAIEQLRDAAVWRAVETGLPVMRSASLGVTMAVDGRGRLLNIAPIGEPVALRVEVESPRPRIAPYWLPIFPIASLLVAVWAIGPRRRNPKS